MTRSPPQYALSIYRPQPFNTIQATPLPISHFHLTKASNVSNPFVSKKRPLSKPLKKISPPALVEPTRVEETGQGRFLAFRTRERGRANQAAAKAALARSSCSLGVCALLAAMQGENHFPCLRGARCSRCPAGNSRKARGLSNASIPREP